MKTTIKILFIFLVIFNNNLSARGVSISQGYNLLITEIAPFGTIDNVNNCKVDISSNFNCSIDKWIEIYNAGDSVIDLSNYYISFGNSSSRDFFRTVWLEGEISPGSFKLIANKNKTIVNAINADYTIGSLQTISKKIDQSSSRVKISLFNQGGLIQEVDGDFQCNNISSIELWEGSFVCSDSDFYINEISTMNASPGFWSGVNIRNEPVVNEVYEVNKTAEAFKIADIKVSPKIEEVEAPENNINESLNVPKVIFSEVIAFSDQAKLYKQETETKNKSIKPNIGYTQFDNIRIYNPSIEKIEIDFNTQKRLLPENELSTLRFKIDNTYIYALIIPILIYLIRKNEYDLKFISISYLFYKTSFY